MKIHGVTPILNVSDVPASLKFFETLGFVRAFTWNEAGMIEGAQNENAAGKARFAGICSPVEGSMAQIFLCCDAQGVRGGKPPRFDGSDDFGAVWMSIWLDSPAEVDEAHQLALENGIVVEHPPTDEPWGVRECRILHPDGHVFRLSAFAGKE